MKRCLIAMLTVFALSLGVCLASFFVIRHVAEEMEGVRTEVLRLIEGDETERAKERLTQMAGIWRDHERLLEAISPHETLHSVTGLIIEAHANLDARDMDDFNRSMLLLGEAIEHLYLEERLRIENIL